MTLYRGVLQNEAGRPRALTVVAILFFTFSAYALFILASGAAHMRSLLGDAWFPLLACVTAAALPAVIGLGLWMTDNAARIGAILFVGLHAISTILWIQHTANATEPRPEIRLALDAMVLALLMSRSSRNACRWEMAPLFDHEQNRGQTDSHLACADKGSFSLEKAAAWPPVHDI